MKALVVVLSLIVFNSCTRKADAASTHKYITVSAIGKIAGCTPNQNKMSFNQVLGVMKNSLNIKDCSTVFVKTGITSVICRKPIHTIVGFYDSKKNCEEYGRMTGVFKE